ncbi:MAG TPA: thiamine pyrophosphate-dependent dehydrogenase E1 component subunit alpha [Candidatus Tectomicrobia bacterium]|nr:thiamine pyrophosphate-dependent dehydrogenase E1 component subunit alpha [Candidatus Tectomicrobia bacterium]
MALTPQQLLHMYRQMRTIRKFDERAVEEFHAGNIPGGVHTYIGQEAVAVGVCAALRRDDKIVSTHRGHGHTIAKGADIKLMMAELFGRSNGYCHGKGGSMHIADFSVGMLGANGIVGAGIPIATGAALAAQLQHSDHVAVAFFGDGASNEGAFHGSLNLASIWKLPAIYVCENNRWASSVPASYALSVPEVAMRSTAYNMPGVSVDGADVIAVYEVAAQAVRRARAGEGPTLIECMTYRWRSHNEQRGNPPDPRPPEEVERAHQHDAIAALEATLVERHMATAATLQQIARQVEAMVEEAVAFAKTSPLPKPEDSLLDVFAP